MALSDDQKLHVEEDPRPASMSQKKLLVIASVILVLAIGGGVAGYFISKKPDSSSSTSSSSNAGGANPSVSGQGSVPATATGGSVSPTTAPPVNNGKVSKAKPRFIGYWGQNAANNGLDIVKGDLQRTRDPSLNQLSLRAYCDLKYYDAINLAFLNVFGGGDGHFTINFAANGVYTWTGTQATGDIASFVTIGQDIAYCQSLGVKMIMSLAGDKISNYSFAKGDGARYAKLWHNAFLGGPDASVRPFGNVVLDGIELDIEKTAQEADPTATSNTWIEEMVTLVKDLKALKSNLILAVVPQCSLTFPGYIGKDKNVGDVIAQIPELFDYIIVQYYNNIECTYPYGFNYNMWTALFPGYIYVGLPGDWSSAISGGFLEPNSLQAVHDYLQDYNQFGGYSVYDISSSNAPGRSWNAVNFANPPVSQYSQTIYNMINGQKVGSGMPAPGPALVENDFGKRCGGTWVHANATCSNKVCNPMAAVTGCGPSEQCFRFLSNTC
ncbi:Chitinase 1 [Chytriomyces hyalinus]|nr:Chitinase 1 [Chytriomyces hyalinus]